MEEEEEVLKLAVASDEELGPGRAKRPKMEVSYETRAVMKEAFTSTLSNTVQGQSPKPRPDRNTLPTARCTTQDQ